MRSLFTSLQRDDYLSNGPTKVKGDNRSSLALVQNPEYHVKSKHIDVQYNYVRELVEDKLVRVEYIPTGQIVGNCLTRTLEPEAFETNLHSLGLKQIPNTAKEWAFKKPQNCQFANAAYNN